MENGVCVCVCVCVCVVWERERVVEMLNTLSDPGCFPALSWPLISELSLKQKEWHWAYSPVTWDPRLDAQLPPSTLLWHKNNSPQSQPQTHLANQALLMPIDFNCPTLESI